MPSLCAEREGLSYQLHTVTSRHGGLWQRRNRGERSLQLNLKREIGKKKKKNFKHFSIAMTQLPFAWQFFEFLIFALTNLSISPEFVVWVLCNESGNERETRIRKKRERNGVRKTNLQTVNEWRTHTTTWTVDVNSPVQLRCCRSGTGGEGASYLQVLKSFRHKMNQHEGWSDGTRVGASGSKSLSRSLVETHLRCEETGFDRWTCGIVQSQVMPVMSSTELCWLLYGASSCGSQWQSPWVTLLNEWVQFGCLVSSFTKWPVVKSTFCVIADWRWLHCREQSTPSLCMILNQHHWIEEWA